MPYNSSPVITLEEHYLDCEIAEYYQVRASPIRKMLEDFGSIRLGDMDAGGVDIQILSHAPPGLQGVEAKIAPALARRVNDRLHDLVNGNPSRFMAFASLPTAVPEAAADELERAVVDLRFKGAMIHGLTDGMFIDERRFWPILARAEKLDVPIYLHPADPHPAVTKAYFGNYAQTHPMFLRAAWGYTFETGTQATRLVLSGALDAYPRLKIILGHMGEAIPFLLPRMQEALSRDTPMKDFRGYFSRHFFVTTSGFFSDSALLCCMQELGIDRIMFSIDWPFASIQTGVDWIRRAPLSQGDREKILHGNARELLKMPRLSQAGG